VTRSLAAVPSIQEVEQACAQYLVLFRQVHAFAYEAGGGGAGRASEASKPTEDTALNGLDEDNHDSRVGARSSLVAMGQHLDRGITAGLGAIRVVQRTGDVAKSQTWTVQQAEDVSSEYEQRKRRGQAHARSAGA
jgi:hypothetical protein